MDEQDDRPELGPKMIKIRTALIAYAVLAVIAVIVLKGYALALALIVVCGAAVKTYVQYLRERME